MPRFKDRTGESKLNIYGNRITIVQYNEANNIIVKFDDGTIVKNKRYNDFKYGKIFNPNTRATDRIGLTKYNKRMQVMKIITYRSDEDIDVQIDNQYVITHTNWKAFQNCNVIYKEQKQHTHKENLITHNKSNKTVNNHIGETVINKKGQKATIISWNNRRDITVQFEDGSILNHGIYDRFKKGQIYPYINHIGEILTNKYGETIEIIDQLGKGTVIAKFSNNETIKIGYTRLKRGYLHSSDIQIKRRRTSEEYTGEIIELNSGLKATIIEYKSNKKAKIRLQDGTIIEKADSRSLIRGDIGHPKYSRVKKITTYKGKSLFECTCKKCKGKHMLLDTEMKNFECNYK